LSDVYSHPRYYEIAFNFRDIPAEVSLFEECIKRYSDIPVKSVLELGCGNCPHLAEMASRGYKYTGLDLNDNMLEYSRSNAREKGIAADLVHGDMVDFSLETQVDFAFVMLGSLAVKSTAELSSHFDSVARVVHVGGLYLLDWCIQAETPLAVDDGSTWEMEADGVKVKTNVRWKAVSLTEQLFDETITLDVDDHGKKLRFVDTDRKRAIYPQELLLFISMHKHWEFVGWWNNWYLDQSLEKKSENTSRPIVLLRRI